MAKIKLQTPFWTRQKGESDQAWRAFVIYRDTPINEKRTFSSVAEKCQKNESLIRRWGKDNGWRDRVLAYDRYLDSVRVNQIKRRAVEMNERHATLATNMLSIVSNALVDFIATDENPIALKELNAKDLKEWADIAVRMERQARGEASVIIEPHRDEKREELIREAKRFYDEMTRDAPEMTAVEKLDIIRTEFHVDPIEIGVTVNDKGDEDKAE